MPEEEMGIWALVEGPVVGLQTMRTLLKGTGSYEGSESPLVCK